MVMVSANPEETVAGHFLTVAEHSFKPLDTF